MLTTVKEHMEIIKGLEGLGWQEILGFSNQQLLLFTKEIDTEKKTRMDFAREFLYKSRVYTGGLPVCHKSGGPIEILSGVSTSLCSQTSEKTLFEVV